MSEENKEQPQPPARAAGGARQTRGAAGGKPARGAGARQTRVGAAGAKPAGVKATGAKPAGVRPKGNKEAATKKEEGAEGAESGPKDTKAAEPKVLLKKFSPVYIIKSDVIETNCLMCRNPLNEVCNTCKQKRITDPAQCPFLTGKCGHRFHSHCIDGWVKDHTQCPHPGCDARWQLA